MLGHHRPPGQRVGTGGLHRRSDGAPGENIDTGLDRLLRTAGARIPAGDRLVSNLTATLGPTGSDDDVAMPAFRWTDPQDAPEVRSPRLDPVR